MYSTQVIEFGAPGGNRIRDLPLRRRRRVHLQVSDVQDHVSRPVLIKRRRQSALFPHKPAVSAKILGRLADTSYMGVAA